jgi:RHS repeat-associated protein
VANHLGNVLVVVSDIKIIVQEAGIITGYQAQIISATDYSPFGVALEGRSWSVGSGYRYGFNGLESDTELFSGSINFEYRVSDARLGRFLTMDPLTRELPFNSSYVFCENRVIDGIDLEGLEWTSSTTKNPDGSETVNLNILLTVVNSSGLIQEAQVGPIMDVIKAHVQQVLTLEDRDKNIKYVTTLSYSIIPEGESAPEGAFVIELVDSTPTAPSSGLMQLGEAVVGQTQSGNFQVAVAETEIITDTEGNQSSVLKPIRVDKVASVAVHEMGHTGGLNHPYADVIEGRENNYGSYLKVNPNGPQELKDAWRDGLNYLNKPNCKDGNFMKLDVFENFMCQTIGAQVFNDWKKMTDKLHKCRGYDGRTLDPLRDTAMPCQLEVIRQTVEGKQNK